MLKKNIRYLDILVLVIVIVIGYKIVDNYNVYFSLIKKFLVILSPFIYAIIIAYILNPIMKLFEKRCKLKRGIAVAITYILVTGIVVIIGLYVIPSVIDSIISMTKEIPSYVAKGQEWLNDLLRDDRFYDLMKDAGILQTITNISTKFGTMAVGMLESSVTSLLSITANVVMAGFGFLVSIYILLDKERLIYNVKLLFTMVSGERIGLRVLNVLRLYNKMIGVYVGTKALDSTIIGIIALIGLIILDAPYAILLAIVVGFTNMIPYFGPFIGEIVAAIVCVFVSPWKAIIVFLFLLGVQQFDAWYLDPKLIGDKVGVKPFFIILGVTIGGGFFGPIGMLLASPTIATIKIYYDKRVEKYEKNNKEVIERL
ncbi:MAG: AI-2E family transporter [Clostridium sp.]|uniref:AI-2E family transporter n=1 Tax=Clostridium sp. TaxID=1506 RepID=UPI003EE4ADCE